MASIQRPQVGLAAVTSTGPYAACCIIGIEQRGKLAAVMPRRMHNSETTDEAARAVDADVVLVAKQRPGNLAQGLTLRSFR